MVSYPISPISWTSFVTDMLLRKIVYKGQNITKFWSIVFLVADIVTLNAVVLAVHCS